MLEFWASQLAISSAQAVDWLKSPPVCLKSQSEVWNAQQPLAGVFPSLGLRSRRWQIANTYWHINVCSNPVCLSLSCWHDINTDPTFNHCSAMKANQVHSLTPHFENPITFFLIVPLEGDAIRGEASSSKYNCCSLRRHVWNLELEYIVIEKAN